MKAAHRAQEAMPGTDHVGPRTATGLALTTAFVAIAIGGVIVGVLTYLVRTDTGLQRADGAIERWADRHETAAGSDVLTTITHLGDPTSVIILAALLAVLETLRTRNRWVLPFVLMVVAGNGIVTTTIKEAADRVRPALNPIAETLGPSFPSGHSSWSAAFLAAAALLITRNRPPGVRPWIIGVCAGLAVTVAATRVLLGVHWLSDAVAGLILGWTWFAACAIAFGGRRLRFGAPYSS